MAEDWKSPSFRQRNVQQIAELLRLIPNPTQKSANDLELQVFNRSKKKEDYMTIMARLVLHYKDQAQPTSQNNPHLAAMLTGPNGTQPGQMGQQPQQIGQTPQQMGQTGQMGGPNIQGNPQLVQGGQMVQGNHMGNAQIGPGNQMNNQQLNQVNQQMGQAQMGGHGSQGISGMTAMGQQMGMISHGQPMGMGGQMGPSPGQAGQMGMTRGVGQINQGLGQQMGIVGQNPAGMGMGSNQVMNNTSVGMMVQNQGMVGPRMPQAMGMPGQGGEMAWQAANSHRMSDASMVGMKQGMAAMPGPMVAKMGPIQMPMSAQGSVGNQAGVGMNKVGPVAAVGSNVMQPRIPSPSFPVTASNVVQGRQNVSNAVSGASPVPSMVSNSQPQLQTSQHSPAFISPSPSSAMVPSPVGSVGRAAPGVMGAPSPSGGIVNPSAQPMQASPASSNQMEEKAYLEKLKQLQKYVEPLKRLYLNCGNEEGKMNEAGKMKKLLDLLQNPRRRMPMETLRKCEEVLEKLDIHREMKGESDSQPVHKESAVDVLMEGIRCALNSPNAANIFYRTLAPALQKLNGCSIPLPSKPKRRKIEEPQSDTGLPKISYIIQGEVARLPRRFKVNLDSQQPLGSDDLSLICHLDDINLPCVPPLTLVIPAQYPDRPPIATLSQQEYSNTTEFLARVEDVFKRRQTYLPTCATITMLLDMWEMSIRQACSPAAINNPNAVSPFTAIMELMNEK